MAKEIKLNPEMAGEQIAQPITDIPAGHKRDEELRFRKDNLQEAIEQDAAATGQHALNESKLRNVDNEIAQYWNKPTGNYPITNPQPGYHYAWVPVPEFRGNSDAKTAVWAIHQLLTSKGWHLVEGDMPEGVEYKGNANAAGTTARGIGDCKLFRIREQEYAKIQEENHRRMRQQGIVEENIEYLAQRLGYPGSAHSLSSNDPSVQRAFSASQRSPITIPIRESDLRAGTIPGMAIGRR